MNEQDILSRQITIFPSLSTTASPHIFTIGSAVRLIANGHKESLPIIEKIRENKGDKSLKKRLPVILFSGVFSKRDDASLQKHSGVMCVDIDGVDNLTVKRDLSFDPYTLACFTSPSGTGVKVLVKISNTERHRDHYRAICAYYLEKLSLTADPTSINVSRACFMSYDPDILVNEHSEVYGGMISEEKKPKEKVNINPSSINTDYDTLSIACKMIRKAPDGDKHSILLRASILCGGYIASGNMEEEEVVRVLSKEISKKDIMSLNGALHTIRDGIAKGKTQPIKTLSDERGKMQRELKILDGDMSFISSDDSDFNWISSFISGAITQGMPIGIPEMDRHWRYKKNFTIINGHSNIGKTTFALYLQVASAMKFNWKWAVYSSENKTAAIKMRLMTFAMGMPINQMTNAQVRSSYEWVNKHFVIIDNSQTYSVHDIILFSHKLMNNEGIDGVFIDPYNGLKRDMKNAYSLGVHEYDYEAVSELLTMSNSSNIAVWLNVHAVTEAQRVKGKDGLPVPPFAEQTEGGAKFVNRADDFITLHRKIQHPDPAMRRLVEMHIRKIRETETGGSPTGFEEPLTFQANQQRDTFYFRDGSRLFKPLYEHPF